MPDEHGNTEAEQEPAQNTPLHAYKDEERRDQVKGDVDALASGDPEQMDRDRREEEDEPQLPKH
jgi:hypothetical protein